MRINLFIFLICVITGGYTFGQNNFLRLIENEKFEKAEKKINEAINESPDDIGVNFSMAVLYLNRKYQKYNTIKSYEYLMKSQSIFQTNTDEHTIKQLSKVPINQLIFTDYTDSISRQALEDAININQEENYEAYLNYYKTAPSQYKNKAVQYRDVAAFKIARETNSEASYQYFILKYPNAIQSYDAIKYRNALAYAKAKAIDNIQNYKDFVNKYPDADEINQSWERIHELAYAQTEKANTAIAFQSFIREYPKSKQYLKAFKLFEEKQFFENTIKDDWNTYRSFLESYPTNSLVPIAQDSIFAIGSRNENFEILKFCIDNFTGNKRENALLAYHNIYTNDGEKQTLNLFYNKYDEDFLNEIKRKDYELAELGDDLLLNHLYESVNYLKYDEYIRLAAPIEKAFVALQKMISNDIKTKNWKSAINTINSYQFYFGSKTQKLKNLISILNSNWDNSIKVNSVGNGINTVSGGEYAPVISADNKLLYFCGRDKKENIWGEDIFVSKNINGNWSTSKIISDLSFFNSNDAPLSISSDGTKMLLFKSGKLYYTDKTYTGWSESVEFPEQINAGDWQADAMISSDGKALIFSSTKEGGYNLYQSDGIYHGSNQFSSDIYVSLLNDNQEWGEPFNLGNKINTLYCERSPFLHPDMKTLYFSSDGYGGLGDLDVYKTTRLADSCWDCWSEPENMGKEINTNERDWGYKISTDGEKAYFSKVSNDEKDDIFWLNIPKHLRPGFVATISGKLTDKNNQPVAAEIRWEDLETGKNVGQSKSDPTDGSFFIVLPLGKIYGYYVDKDEYFPISKNIDLRNKNKAVDVEEKTDIVSFKQMIEEGTAVPVNNLFFNYAKAELLPYSIPELKRVAQIIKSRKLKVEISGHTDNVGTDEQNQLLSEQRAMAVKVFLSNEGCLADNLTTIGYGKSKPITSNDNEAGRAKNRRVELKLIK
ncbi:MAG: OmpA family protein [Bacteroidales bacterium]